MLTPRFGPLSLDSDVVQLLQLLPPENQNTRGSRPRLYFYHDYSLWRLGHVVAVSRTSIWSGIWAVCEQVEHLITKPLAFPKQSRVMPWPCTDGLASRSTVAMYALSQHDLANQSSKSCFWTVFGQRIWTSTLLEHAISFIESHMLESQPCLIGPGPRR